MRYFLITLLGAFLLAACQTSPTTAEAVYTDAEVQQKMSLMKQGSLEGSSLNTKQIKAFFSGANVRGISRDGERIGFSLTNDGEKMFALRASFYDESGQVIRKDEGYWWTAGEDKICGKLQNYDRNRSHCFTVALNDKDFFLKDRKGEQVYWFRIVSLYDPSIAEQPVNKSENSDEYNVGTLVGYSQVCSQFRGSGADTKIIQAIKNIYGGNREFARGYAQYESFTGADFVSRLYDCEKVRTALEKIYGVLKATTG